jgi:hypothetical protein
MTDRGSECRRARSKRVLRPRLFGVKPAVNLAPLRRKNARTQKAPPRTGVQSCAGGWRQAGV